MRPTVIYPLTGRGATTFVWSVSLDRSFCASFPRFLDTSETVQSRNRLDARYRAIVDWNRGLLRDARVLDLACHDGRWAFGALQIGASHTTGIEARPHLVEKARENFAFYDIRPTSYTFLTGLVMPTMASLPDQFVDVTMCLGFLYHSHEHASLLLEASRLTTRALIIDTEVADSAEPIILLREERTDDSRNSVDYVGFGRPKALVGTPSRAALFMILDHAGFDIQSYDWQAQQITDWSNLDDYRTGKRITIRAERRK